MRPLVEELRVTAAAQTELGDDYDRAVVHSLAERLEAELAARDRDRRLAVWQDAVTVVIALGSIGLGILVGAAADGLGVAGRRRGQRALDQLGLLDGELRRRRRALLDQPHRDQPGDDAEQQDQHARDQEPGPQGRRDVE